MKHEEEISCSKIELFMGSDLSMCGTNQGNQDVQVKGRNHVEEPNVTHLTGQGRLGLREGLTSETDS